MKTSKFDQLDRIFLPRSAAVIGASPRDGFANTLVRTKIGDRLFMVNPNYQEILGKKSYASILDVEDPIDYAVIAVSSQLVIGAVRECIEKGLKAVHVFASGFSETGLEEGIKLEKELASLAKGKIRLIGPNCMGIYCPKSGLSFNTAATNEEGSIGVISQSGTFAQMFNYFERSMNMKISKLVSYGNAVDLDCPDFLEYLADDPYTSVIALYIEGTRQGTRLHSALKYAAGKKPVAALKGGVTREGGRVASSHTGTLAGTGETWSAMFRQSGAIQVEDIDDLMNTTVALSSSPPPGGKGVSIITYSGGFSVVQSDMCVKAGLEVPQFSKEAVGELRKIVPVAGTMMGNPLDAWQMFYRYSGNESRLADVFRIIAAEKHIHSIILQFDVIKFMVRMWGGQAGEQLEVIARNFLEGCRYARDEAGKLVLITVYLDPYTDHEQERQLSFFLKKLCQSQDFPVYPTLNEAIRTVAYMYRYSIIRQDGGKGQVEG